VYLPVQTSIYTGIGVIDNTVYTCDHADHGLYIRTRVCTFFLFLLSNLLLHVCVSHVFFNIAYVGGKGLEVGSFSACPWLALVAGVEVCVLAGVHQENIFVRVE